jgi:hypothetical protein
MNSNSLTKPRINVDLFNLIDNYVTDIIISYLKIKDYKKINTYFNEIAKNKASSIISKNIKKLNLDMIHYMNRMAEIEFSSYYNDNFEIEIDNIMKNDIILFYKKVIPVVQRNNTKCEYIITKQLEYLRMNLYEYIRLSMVRVEFEMSEVYTNNLEMLSLQRKLMILSLDFIKSEHFIDLELEYTFCNKYIDNNYSIESTMFHIENLLYMSIIQFLAEKNIRLNSFCDEYILYIVMKDIFNEIILAIKDRLNAICAQKNNKVNYDKLIMYIEPTVLVKNNYYMFK